jgi:hypothetical protein
MTMKIVFLLILNISLIAAFLVGTAERLTDDVWTVRLRGCYLDYHESIHTMALACPGVDCIKLWPLPVEQSWWEPDPLPEPWPGSYAKR